MADLSTDLSERLAPIVAQSLAVATVDITSLTRLTGGASRETWQCVAFADGVEHRMILQRGRVAPGGANSASAGMEAEGEVLAAAEASGVPVAHVWARDGGVDRLGAPFLLTSFVAGETIARKIQRDEYFGVARENLVRDLGLAAAKLHSVPVDLFDFLTQVDPIEHYREVLDTLGFAHPAFELGFKYLAANKPSMVSTCLVHGDLRLGNVIVNENGLAAIIDWELAHLGDPMEDLGWLCVRAWRFGGKAPVAGLGDYETLFAAYEEASGRVVDPAVVRWWEVMGTLKWGIMCIMQTSAHLTSMSRSVELAAIGRRVCENEYDLLELIS